MSSRPDLLAEASRQLSVCNACRYCEGYCAVFPALARRTEVKEKDTLFLASLCHDCRACYQACMFTLPNAFAINVPAAMSEVRVATYSRFAWPRRLGRLAERRSVAVTGGLVLIGLLMALGAIAATGGLGRFFTPDGTAGAFYRLIPYLLLVGGGLAATAYIVVALGVGLARFWRETGSPWRDVIDLRAWFRALGDAAVLTNLRGGGDDCYQPDPVRSSAARRLLHQAVLYGFLLDFISTTAAAIQQDLFGQEPPFAVLSVPVITGSVGGVMMVAGCTGLLWLKARSLKAARDLIAPRMLSMDWAFIVVLDLVALTGMLTLFLRDTAALPAMLTVHLGTLVALYATVPYGKFLHVGYRMAALLKNRVEQAREGAG